MNELDLALIIEKSTIKKPYMRSPNNEETSTSEF